MAKVTLKVAHNVSLARGGSIHRAGDTFETESDDETAQWLKHAYVEQVKAREGRPQRR